MKVNEIIDLIAKSSVLSIRRSKLENKSYLTTRPDGVD